jgi:predicted SPOUT superfamily RNA methylase MTH1
VQRLNDIKFDIAIPDSYLFGVKTDVDKTLKVFQLSRALSIFSVNNINIYHDKVLNPSNYERKFLSTILEYLDTPQYLRRKIYPRSDILNEVGRLHPIRSPHHKDKVDLKNLKSGDIRVGLVERKEGQFYVDVGLESLIKYEGKFRQSGKKINVKLIRQHKQVVGVKMVIFLTCSGDILCIILQI